jgi:transcriptional regulator with XRE-family HTH domain
MPPVVSEDMSVGDRIALWREYRGMTQETCAGLVGRSLSWWKQVESGVCRVERFSDLVLVAQVLGVRDLVDLTGSLEFCLARDRARDHPVLPGIRAAMLRTITPEPEAAERPHGPVGSRLEAARRAYHEDRLSLAVTGRLLPDLIVDATTDYRRACGKPGTEGRRAARAAAALLSDVYVLTTQVLRHASDAALAATAVDRAAHYAHEADDPVRIGWTVWQSSGVLKDTGRPEEGLAQCADALALLEPLLADPTDERVSLYGELSLQAGLMAGHCSDEGTALRHVDLGTAAYRRVSQHYRSPVTRYGQDGPLWAALWVPTALGQFRDALAVAERTDPGAVPSRPFQAWWWIHAARGYAARREDVSTLHVLQRAEDASPETVAQSTDVREMCREMLRRDRKPISRELREFAHRIGIHT